MTELPRIWNSRMRKAIYFSCASTDRHVSGMYALDKKKQNLIPPTCFGDWILEFPTELRASLIHCLRAQIKNP